MSNTVWIEGEPPHAMWCIAASRSPDKDEHYFVWSMWYNPNGLPKWWVGHPGKTEPWTLPVRCWMPMPDKPEPNGTPAPPDDSPPLFHKRL